MNAQDKKVTKITGNENHVHHRSLSTESGYASNENSYSIFHDRLIEKLVMTTELASERSVHHDGFATEPTGPGSTAKAIQNWTFNHESQDELDNTCSASSCVGKSHKVHVQVQVDTGPNKYMFVDGEHYVEARNVANPDNAQVIFECSPVQGEKDNFAVTLRNSSIFNAAVGIGDYQNGVPLSLQLCTEPAWKYQLLINYYQQDILREYFALSFKAPDGKLHYVLPSRNSSRLCIYTSDDYADMRDRTAYIFRIAVISCSNSDGACAFKRLMKSS